MKLRELILTGFIAGALVACGGGGSSSAPDNPADAAGLTVSGTAATGLAIPGAVVSAKCQVGTGAATTRADGTYNLVIANGKMPCVLQITNPADGSKLHTVATGEGSAAIANITPLTEMLTARVLGNEPAVFFAAFDASVATTTVTAATVTAAQTDVATILSGTLDTRALGDFLKTPFKAATQDNVAGGDAQDKMLDALGEKIDGAQLTQVVTALAHTPSIQDIKQVVVSVSAVPPTANAGAMQSVVTGTAVTLDGSVSTAVRGRMLTYSWTLTSKPAGSVATLSLPDSVNPVFTADVAGEYVISLVVNDGNVASAAAVVTITASRANAAPVANAGPAQNVVAGSIVTLNGSASSDANGDALSHLWTLTAKPAGSSATLAVPTAVTPTFKADVAGTYVASLVVNDGKISSDAATVTVTASVVNAAPVANAGTGFTWHSPSFNPPQSSTLDGSASTDANGDPLTYKWTLVSRPGASNAALTSSTSPKPTISVDSEGSYVVSLVVNDGQLDSATATMTFNATTTNGEPLPVGNVAPVARIASSGSGLTLHYTNYNPSVPLTLDGSASTDANGDRMSYAWGLVSKPAASNATLTSSTSSKPTISVDSEGTYVVSLVVNDGQLNSATATMTFNATTTVGTKGSQ